MEDTDFDKRFIVSRKRRPKSVFSRDLIFTSPELRLEVRPVSADDLLREREFFQSQTADERYSRFFCPKKGLREKEAHDLVFVDYTQDFALCAVDLETDGFVGVARYVHTSVKGEVEMAVAVLKKYQRLGIARYLLTQLFKIARQESHTLIKADFMMWNRAVVSLFDKVAEYCGAKGRMVSNRDGVLSYEYSLTPADRDGNTELAQVAGSA